MEDKDPMWLRGFLPDNNAKSSKNDYQPQIKQGKTSIDLHGKRVSEARIQLKNAIARAQAQGFRQLWVIHGKGQNGSPLGDLVKEIAESTPSIKSHFIPSEKDGGRGVRVLEFR